MIYLSLFLKISALGLYFVICLSYFLQSISSGYFSDVFDFEEDEEGAFTGFF